MKMAAALLLIAAAAVVAEAFDYKATQPLDTWDFEHVARGAHHVTRTPYIV